jgi:uncharacterized RDD family membrane protein YckC
MGVHSVYASFSRRALAGFIDLCLVLAPCGISYLVKRAFGFTLRYTTLSYWQRPETATMFMTYDFPGIFAIFTGIKLFMAYPYFALMERSRRQGTVGKLAMGIKVTDLTGFTLRFAGA